MTELTRVYKEVNGEWTWVTEEEAGGGSLPGVWANGQSALTAMFCTGPAYFSLHPLKTISGGDLVGGDTPTGRLSGFTQAPLQVYGPGQILDLDSAFTVAQLAGEVEEVPSPFLLGIDAVVIVCDAVGDNTAHCVVAGFLVAPITDLAYTADFSAAAWVIDVGTDLTSVDRSLSSTAGGVYSIWFGIQAAWDS